MNEPNFERFWESTLSPDTPERLVAHWRRHELSAVQRGSEVVVRLAEFTPLEGRRVLDLGCGYGGLSVALSLAGASVVGVDFDAKRLVGALTRARGDHPASRLGWVQCPAEQLPFARGQFDAVVCNDVLEHVQSHPGTLSEIARVLRPGGWLYLQFPNRLSPGNLKSDPHYGLFGVSLLPPRLGGLYVVHLRRRSRSYDVGTFPIAGRVLRTLLGLGIRPARWLPAPKRQIGWLTPVPRAWRLNTSPIVVVIGQRCA